MTLAGFERIAVDPAICGGRPVVAGTRVRVTDVLEMLAGGASAAQIVTDFPYLTEADVRAVLAYAAAMVDHPVVLAAQPGERSKAAGRRFPDPGAAPDREKLLARLRANETELRAAGIQRLSLFGSVARGEAGPASDVDLAVELNHAQNMDLLDFAELNLRLSDLLETKVDLVSEPARNADFQARIERDRVHAF